MKKIRVAFIKFAGLSAGGSEKLLQIIAANLPKDGFEMDFYYSDSAPFIGDPAYRVGGTDPYRLEYMKAHGVNLIEFKVGAVDITKPTRPWIDTNFWQLFSERNYDIIQTCRAGHKEYPFTKIRHTPIIDIIALSSGSDNQYNIARVMHICQWSADGWVRRGGDKNRVVLISLPISISQKNYPVMREKLGQKGKIIFGFHQRPSDDIFSEIPLRAYKQIENDNTAFLLLGGSEKYKRQAQELGLKNIHFLPPSGDQEVIYRFLGTLNVYAHGRKDGEVNSQAMGEAMYFGLPIVSHYSEVNNGHVECIAEAGVVVHTIEQYAAELKKLMTDESYYKFRSMKAKERFAEKYELRNQLANIVSIYKDVVTNPFPHKFSRYWSSVHYTQNIRVLLVKVYLYIKYHWKLDLLKFLHSQQDD